MSESRCQIVIKDGRNPSIDLLMGEHNQYVPNHTDLQVHSHAHTRSHTLTHTDTYTKCTCSLDLESYETKSKSKGAPKASTCHAHTRKIQARKHMLPYLYGTQISTQYTHSRTHTHTQEHSLSNAVGVG